MLSSVRARSRVCADASPPLAPADRPGRSQVAGLLLATIDMFKLAILIKDPELAQTKQPPELLKHHTAEEVLAAKKAALVALMVIEAALILFGALLICAVNCREACLGSLVLGYLALDTLVVAGQLFLLFYDPSLIYPISSPSLDAPAEGEPSGRGGASFFHYTHGFFVAVQCLMQCYFCRVVLSYLCRTHCSRQQRA